MALGVNTIKKALGLKDEPTKSDKKHGFLHGVKEFIISPSGVVTILMFSGVIWYVHKHFKKHEA